MRTIGRERERERERDCLNKTSNMPEPYLLNRFISGRLNACHNHAVTFDNNL